MQFGTQRGTLYVQALARKIWSGQEGRLALLHTPTGSCCSPQTFLCGPHMQPCHPWRCSCSYRQRRVFLGVRNQQHNLPRSTAPHHTQSQDSEDVKSKNPHAHACARFWTSPASCPTLLPDTTPDAGWCQRQKTPLGTSCTGPSLLGRQNTSVCRCLLALCSRCCCPCRCCHHLCNFLLPRLVR